MMKVKIGHRGMQLVGGILFVLFPQLVYSQFSISSSITPVTCPGGSDGAVVLNVSGGVPPYTYSWNPGSATTSLVTGIAAGNYTVTITDANASDSTLVLPVTQPLPFNDQAQVKNPLCTSNGFILLFPSGGTAPYSYLWSTGSTGQTIMNIPAGDYSVIMTDAATCTVQFTYSVPEADCFVKPQSYFTPNGDGIHDTWVISNAQYFPNARLIVFDRWGTRVYEHKGTYEPWNGKSYLGLNVPDAVYYYFFYEDKDDKQKNAVTGSVTILR